MERPAWLWWALVCGGLGFLCFLAFGPAEGVLPMFPRPALRIIALVAALLHMGEAAYAYRLAKASGLDAKGWTLQTFVLGYPSLRLLLKRVRK